MLLNTRNILPRGRPDLDDEKTGARAPRRLIAGRYVKPGRKAWRPAKAKGGGQAGGDNALRAA
jgi:hypothetical protein